jgi:hypothetical protein
LAFVSELGGMARLSPRFEPFHEGL